MAAGLSGAGIPEGHPEELHERGVGEDAELPGERAGGPGLVQWGGAGSRGREPQLAAGHAGAEEVGGFREGLSQAGGLAHEDPGARCVEAGAGEGERIRSDHMVIVISRKKVRERELGYYKSSYSFLGESEMMVESRRPLV